MHQWDVKQIDERDSRFVKVISAIQALTTRGKIRLPIGQPAGKYQVAPIESQVAPCRKLL